MYDLLNYLDMKYQIPALINTSFNCRGMPIVHTTQEALHDANIMKLDAVVLNCALHIIG